MFLQRLRHSVRLGPGLRGCVLLAWIGAGCGATSPWKHENIYSRPPVFLFHEYQEKDGKRSSLGYDHPIEVSLDQVVSLLAQLKYDRSYIFHKAKIRPVFSGANVASLAGPLVQALQGLAPDERLRFVLAEYTGSTFSTSLTGSSGVIFKSEADRMSIAFDVINDFLPTPEGGTSASMKFPEDPTRIIDASALEPFPGATHHSNASSGVTYPRWLEVEMNLVPIVARSPPATKPSARELPSSPEEHLDEIRRRLQDLKHLREDGTLTQEQYDKAVQKALGDL